MSAASSRSVEDWSGFAYRPSALPKDLSQPPTDETFSRLEDDIKDHCEWRIQIAVLQCVLVRQTGRVFEGQETSHQIGQGTRQYHAAHSSTLPSLAFQHPQEDGYDKIAFGEGWIGDTWNATMLLPKAVNELDSRLDGTNSTPKLRGDALRILNEVSAGHLTPQEAARTFIEHLLARIQKSEAALRGQRTKLEHLPSETDPSAEHHQRQDRLKCNHKITALSWYEGVARDYQTQLQGSDVLLHRICWGDPECAQREMMRTMPRPWEGRVVAVIRRSAREAAGVLPKLNTKAAEQYEKPCLASATVHEVFRRPDATEEEKRTAVVRVCYKQPTELAALVVRLNVLVPQAPLPAAAPSTPPRSPSVSPGSPERKLPILSKASLKAKKDCLQDAQIQEIARRYFVTPEAQRQVIRIELATRVIDVCKREPRDLAALVDWILSDSSQKFLA